MTESDEGITTVNVRDLWPHESLDFTPWLANNLDRVGQAIGLKLELVQQEKLIGSLWLDILAKESESGALVAIENQLEWTDIDHLGRLLVYAAGCEAKVAILVAPEFMHEHAKLLHQLNEWAGSNASFYGVKVEAIKKTGSSDPEPRLLKVVWPGGWNKAITLDPVPPPRPEVQRHRDFFQPLIEELMRSRFADKSVQHYDYRARFFPSRVNGGVGYAVFLYGNDAWVTLYIGTEDKDLNKRLFDALKADQQQIESSSILASDDLEWHWLRHDKHLFSSIDVRKDGSIDDPPEKLEKTREWMLDLLPKFKEVFDPRLARILDDYGMSG